MRCSSETLHGASRGTAHRGGQRGTAAHGELCWAGSGAAGRELCSPYGTAASLAWHAPFALLWRTEILWLRFLLAAGDACARGVQAEARSVELSSCLRGLSPNPPQCRRRGGLVQAGGTHLPDDRPASGGSFCKSKRIKSLGPAEKSCFPQRARSIERQKCQSSVFLPGAGKFSCPFFAKWGYRLAQPPGIAAS